ncbi:uncharacterized [Tachysurus ichikawai]
MRPLSPVVPCTCSHAVRKTWLKIPLYGSPWRHQWPDSGHQNALCLNSQRLGAEEEDLLLCAQCCQAKEGFLQALPVWMD